MTAWCALRVAVFSFVFSLVNHGLFNLIFLFVCLAKSGLHSKYSNEWLERFILNSVESSRWAHEKKNQILLYENDFNFNCNNRDGTLHVRCCKTTLNYICHICHHIEKILHIQLRKCNIHWFCTSLDTQNWNWVCGIKPKQLNNP